jgi:hypothetical protein
LLDFLLFILFLQYFFFLFDNLYNVWPLYAPTDLNNLFGYYLLPYLEPQNSTVARYEFSFFSPPIIENKQ